MNVHETFRTRLREVTKARGRGTYKQVAIKSGYSEGYIRSMVSGNRNPTIGAIWAVADALDISPFYLLGAVADPNYSPPHSEPCA